MLRVIAGTAKRRALKSPSSATGARPILGRIKKSLFDILRVRLPGADFLDLYAGSGAVGIEALSRGARSVTFVDANPLCLSVIRQNLSRLRMFDRARLVRADITKSLTPAGGPFDLIFMGPPYHDARWKPFHLVDPTLRAVRQAALLRPDGWIIAQHHAKEPVTGDRWETFRRQNYGDTRLSFFQWPD